MIRPLTEQDRKHVVALLSQDRALNLYILGNLETLGLKRDFCQFWGDFEDSSGVLRAVLNRYMNGWTLYGRPDADWAGLAQVVDQHPVPAARLQDNPGGIPSFLPYLQRYRASQEKEEELMTLAPEHFRPVAPPPGATVRRATLADLDALIHLYRDAGSMQRSPAAVERPLRDTRVWVAEVAGQIGAAALTNAEVADLAMIGGVYTVPALRGRGLSQAVCSALCQELLREGKGPVLYWDTPAAGAVYRKLGFQAVGRWRSVWLAPAD